MGVITTFKNRLIGKVNDKIAGLSELSGKQIQEIEEKKKKYLEEKPNMNSEENQKLVKKMLGTLGTEVYNAYLPELDSIYTPIPTIPDEGDDKTSSANRIAYFDITKWVVNAEENYLDKLVNVYHVMSNEPCSIALIYNRTKKKCNVTMAVINNNINEVNADISKSYISRLINAVKGNFPGSIISDKLENGSRKAGIPPCLNYNESKNIAAITNVATEKSEKFISQSIEKLLDGVVPQTKNQEYTFMLLATPSQDSFEKQNRLSEIYSALVPFSSWQTNFTYTESDNRNASFNLGGSMGLSAGMSSGSSLSAAVHAGLQFVGANISSASNESVNANANMGINFSRSSSVSVNVGKNEGITQNFSNHQIKHTLELLDMQMKRLEQSSALGMWDFASYVISDDYNTTNNVAHMYLALTQGEESFISRSAINIWTKDKNKNETDILLYELAHLQHPVFHLKANLTNDWLMYPEIVDATTTISGRELARSFNLPRKSVAGFPVIECAEFGRNIATYDESSLSAENIKLGKIFHMHSTEANEVKLSLKSLASHTFITGSTGSGKSNTVYNILNCLREKSIPFLVVEPAKGEYKHVFGNDDDVIVYGTNPHLMPLLKINPFSFPKEIHILEHLDRLIEIFNVCWPMYAAMPAVLKSAVEKSYKDCGWDLAESTNKYGDKMYPTFVDIARNVKTIIDSSEYDAENKGAYKGSLLTRLNSLTNGINGMIFTVEELSEKQLFDKSVIVDLSRVGSTETKSLIMGMLILKLQEYRMTSARINSDLNHVTVLEEAHNLLKRTSSDQSADSGNLLGKSVEMIANSIAEMRTYGEGFIIADQAPALLDMAAIRNTNTKIVMRLPDLSDRELVGRSANLNDDQIKELAKLPCGVAAVYQNEWIQPVLCKIDRYNASDEAYIYSRPPKKEKVRDYGKALKIAEMLCKGNNPGMNIKELTRYLSDLGLMPSMQVRAVELLIDSVKVPKVTKIAPIISSLFPEVKKELNKAYNESSSETEWSIRSNEILDICIANAKLSDELRTKIIQAIVTDLLYHDLGKPDELQKWYEKGVAK